jgi:hypothetical protein
MTSGANTGLLPTIVLRTTYFAAHLTEPLVERIQFSASAVEYQEMIFQVLEATTKPAKEAPRTIVLKSPVSLANALSVLFTLGFKIEGAPCAQGISAAFLIMTKA